MENFKLVRRLYRKNRINKIDIEMFLIRLFQMSRVVESLPYVKGREVYCSAAVLPNEPANWGYFDVKSYTDILMCGSIKVRSLCIFPSRTGETNA